MQIICPFFSQKAFDRAEKTIQSCFKTKPENGLRYPYYAPGGVYGADWWSLDYTLIIDAVKWLDFSKAEEYIINLFHVQKEDGRIPLFGCDDFQHLKNIREPISSLPKRLRTIPTLLRMKDDRGLWEKGLSVMERDIKWWFDFRCDLDTGLISAVFEETFIPNTESGSMCYAPIDTNIEVMLGCIELSKIYAALGEKTKEQDYLSKAHGIRKAIEKYLWSEEYCTYLPYLFQVKCHAPKQMASCFLGFYTADGLRQSGLLKKLKDPEEYQWTTRPLTTVSLKDQLFTTVKGAYIGNPCWSGSVWTLTNQQTILALLYASKKEEAEYLAVKTVTEFANSFTEFHHPFTGSGEGVQDYGWTAAQIIQIIIEIIFGISYSEQGGLSIDPHIPDGYSDELFAIYNLKLPDGRFADVEIMNGNVSKKLR